MESSTGGVVRGALLLGRLRVNWIAVLQCGQVTEAILGTRSNVKACLHFVQVTDLIFGLDGDIRT